MIKVLRHGNLINVQNPITGEWNEMIVVTFVEEGRAGADRGMSETSAFLSSITGEEVGLNQLRTHSHPVKADKIGLFPIGTEFPGHINRGLFSTPQITQQLDKDPRMIDGKPTYFKTWISQRMEEDTDMRMDNNTLGQMEPNRLFGAAVGAARVQRTSNPNKGFTDTPPNQPVPNPEGGAPVSTLAGAFNQSQG